MSHLVYPSHITRLAIPQNHYSFLMPTVIGFYECRKSLPNFMKYFCKSWRCNLWEALDPASFYTALDPEFTYSSNVHFRSPSPFRIWKRSHEIWTIPHFLLQFLYQIVRNHWSDVRWSLFRKVGVRESIFKEMEKTSK